MKVGDLVKIRDQPYFSQWVGLTAIIHGTETVYNQKVLDVCFVETGEVRLGMSASLFDMFSETEQED